MTDISVATEDLAYCSAEYARVYAVEALLISRSRKIGFYDAYYGLISHHLRDWLEDHILTLDRNIVSKTLQQITRAERQRSFLDLEENKFHKILLDEIIPVGCVLHQMFCGSNKENAMSQAREILSYSNGYSGEIKDLPKSMRHMSKRTLERLWASYAEVLHYVWLATINPMRAQKGLGVVSYDQGREIWGQIMSALDAVSPTRPVSVPEPVFLRFVTVEMIRDQLPELPPIK